MALVLSVSAVASSGSGPFPAIGNETGYARRTWTTKDGLPQNSVNVTLQTSDGFLWVGTNAGLARFDGVRFRTFGLHDGLRSVRISALAEDSQGVLWIGTSGGGVSRHNNGRFDSFGTDNGFPTDGDVIAMTADRSGSIWIGTAEGLVQGRNGVFTLIGEGSGLPRRQIRAIAVDADGRLWASVINDGVYEAEKGQFKRVQGEVAPKGDVYSLLVDSSGAVWAGAGNGKLWRKQQGEWQRFATAPEIPVSRLSSLVEDRSGSVWAAGNMLFRMSEDRLVPAVKETPWVEQAARTITVDRDGSLWAGVGNEGLVRFSPRVVQYWGPSSGLGLSTPTSVLEDDSGGLWAGTTGLGLLRYDQDKFTVTAESGENGKYQNIYSMVSMRDGSVWAAGEQCLLRFDAGKLTKAYHEAPIRGEALRALCPVGDTLWMGTYHSALLKCDGDGPRLVEPAGTFHGSITCIVSDGPDALWIGSFGALHRWERGKVQSWTTRDGMISSSILAIHREQNGTLWLGTLGGGLARMKDGRFTHITVKNGLIDDVISQILVDDTGAFWLGSNLGIMRLDRSELDAVAEGKVSEVHPTVINRNEGLLKEQCASGHGPTSFKGRDGRLYFPMVRGLVAVDPQRFNELGSDPLKIILDGLFVDGVRSPMEGEIELSPGNHRVEINYTTPALREGDWVRFRHRLEGFNGDWVPVGGNRQASFDGLSPGRYVFRVAASDGSGEYHEFGGRLAFIIQPFIWQTLWFRAGCAVLLSGIASAGVWSHLRSKHRRHLRDLERQRQQHAELAHAGRLALLGELSGSLAHELNQPLAAILSNAQAGIRFLRADKIGEMEEILRDIAEADRRASEIITRMRDMIKKGEAQLEARDLNADLAQVLLLVRSDLQARGVSVDTKLEPGIPLVCGDHIQLQQVLLNLIINGCDAMQGLPAEERRIVIETARTGPRFACVSVMDRGAGIHPGMMERLFEPFFSTKSQGLGMGLAICRAIVTAHGGKLWAENNPDCGATFHFTLRVEEGKAPDAHARAGGR